MDPGGEHDEALMQQVAAGKADVLEWLIRRHATGLLTFLTRMLGDRHRAEELFQEIFLAVWLKRKQYQCSRPFRPWLYAIAINRCRAVFRLRAPVPKSLDSPALDDPADSFTSPTDQLINEETASLISHAVTQLPTQQRAVVVLRIWQGMPYDRIAEAVGCTEGTVRSHMHHGLVSLRQLLKPLVEAGAIPHP